MHKALPAVLLLLALAGCSSTSIDGVADDWKQQLDAYALIHSPRGTAEAFLRSRGIRFTTLGKVTFTGSFSCPYRTIHFKDERRERSLLTAREVEAYICIDRSDRVAAHHIIQMNTGF